jgi:hypothetical protein
MSSPLSYLVVGDGVPGTMQVIRHDVDKIKSIAEARKIDQLVLMEGWN